jgi:hypothetical protein
VRPQHRTNQLVFLAAAVVYALPDVPHPTREAPSAYTAGTVFEAGVNWTEKQAKVSTKNDLLVSSRAIRPTSVPRPTHHRGVIYLEKAQFHQGDAITSIPGQRNDRRVNARNVVFDTTMLV